MNAKSLVAGLDMGTSSLKLVILNRSTSQIEFENRKSTSSAKIDSANKLYNEQSVDTIIKLLKELLDEIPSHLISQIEAWQLCGQMHGILLWNTVTSKTSSLTTWQDARCSSEFLASLPVRSECDINSGFGCATLFWHLINSQLSEIRFSEFDQCGTIQDYITYLLTKDSNFMSVHNALSWGFFDIDQKNWQSDLLSYEPFPRHLMPVVQEPGFRISQRVSDTLIPNPLDSSVYVSLGDLQCSVYSCLEQETDCFINISTSSQVCVAVNKIKYDAIKSNLPKSVTMFPYFDDQVLLVAASLNGGNVLEHFIDTILSWNQDLGLAHTINREQIWSRLLTLAPQHSSLVTDSRLFGERHDRNSCASVNNIRVDNLSIGNMFDSVCKGLISNLKDMMPESLLIQELGCKRLIATGSALVQNQVLKKHLESQFSSLEIVYKSSSDSAMGAALYLKNILNKTSKS